MSLFGKKFEHIFFDCDSTLSSIEGIDELADLKGKKPEIAVITDQTMNGGLDFLTALRQRLEVIRPSRSDLHKVGELYIQKITPGAVETIRQLHESNKKVYIVSGGFFESIVPLGEKLGISSEKIFANKIYFDSSGNYKGFDEQMPTAQSNGKKIIVEAYKGTKIMIGDGASDYEVGNAVDLMVGFCGISRRKIVEDNADIVFYQKDLSVLISIINFIENDSQSELISLPVRLNHPDLRANS
ncbi:HAD-IB family phosphatase [bacterium]|nr:HAD-IB family phosphatase [bacterium]